MKRKTPRFTTGNTFSSWQPTGKRIPKPKKASPEKPIQSPTKKIRRMPAS